MNRNRRLTLFLIVGASTKVLGALIFVIAHKLVKNIFIDNLFVVSFTPAFNFFLHRFVTFSDRSPIRAHYRYGLSVVAGIFLDSLITGVLISRTGQVFLSKLISSSTLTLIMAYFLDRFVFPRRLLISED